MYSQAVTIATTQTAQHKLSLQPETGSSPSGSGLYLKEPPLDANPVTLLLEPDLKRNTSPRSHSKAHTQTLTFQSSEVTSLLLGTSWPPSRMQCLKTSWVDPPVLFSLRFQIRAVESPDLHKASRNIRGRRQ